MVLMITLFSCKRDTSTQQEPATTESATTPVQQDSVVPGGHDYTFLTQHMLHYVASSTVGKDPSEQPYKDQWIDLEPDGTYKAGKLTKQTHTGKWDYDHDKKILVLRPDDSDRKTTGWQVMHNEDMVVFVGTRTYGDNATQIKLVRKQKFPGED